MESKEYLTIKAVKRCQIPHPITTTFSGKRITLIEACDDVTFIIYGFS